MNCKNCGKLLNQGEMFCTACGTKVDNVQNNMMYQNNNMYPNSNNMQYQNNNMSQMNISSNKPKKNNTLLIIGIIVGSLIIGFLIIFGFIHLFSNIISDIETTSKKLVCTSSKSSITIYYDETTLKGEKTYNYNYDFDEEKLKASNEGVESYLKEFSNNFIKENNGSCIIDGETVSTDSTGLGNDSLGKISYITGGWKYSGDSETYWVFRSGEFWWYKSFNDLNDNYWYGTTTIYQGKEGLKAVGIDEDKADEVIALGNGKITLADIYTIICTPKKIISGGKDLSSTNIPENTKWNQIWILIDHGSEGIEAQVLDVDNNSKNYFIKIKD